MTTLDLRPPELNLHEVNDSDLSLVFPCFDAADGVTPVDVSSGYDFEFDVVRAGTVVESFNVTVTGAGGNIVTATLPRADMVAIGTGRGLEWYGRVTASGKQSYICGGTFRLYNPGSHRERSSTSGGFPVLIGGSEIKALLTVGVPAVDVAENVSIADAGGFFTGTDVEAALQEVGEDLAALPDQYAPLAAARIGTGAPNGVVTGSVGDRYIDRNATLGARVWYKASGSATNTGWLVAEGDTGARQLTGTSLPAGYRGAGSIAFLRRVNSTVIFNLGLVPTTVATDLPVTLLDYPSGFTPAVRNPAADAVANVETGAANPSLAIVRAATTRFEVLTGARLADNAVFVRCMFVGSTNDAWPTSLPGSAI